MRTNSRPMARAIDSPIEVLPVPGGPMSVRIAPERLSAAMPRSSRSFLTATYSTMRSLTSGRPAWSGSSTSRGAVGAGEDVAGAGGVELFLGPLVPRHGDEPVEVGPDRLGLAGLLAGALQALQLAPGPLAPLVGHAGLGDLGAVVLADGGVVLAELAADRLHLLAQDVLALLLGGALFDVLADALAHLQFGEPLALTGEGQLEARRDVDGLQQLDLLLEGQVRGVARRVGQRARLGDGAHPGGDAAVVATQLEDLLDGGAVLALELARAAVDGHVVDALLDLDAQAPGVIGVGGAGDAAGDALEHRAMTAAGEADALRDGRDGADGGVLALVARDEQDALLTGGVHRQGDVHRGEDDGVVERDEKEGRQAEILWAANRCFCNGCDDLSAWDS